MNIHSRIFCFQKMAAFFLLVFASILLPVQAGSKAKTGYFVLKSNQLVIHVFAPTSLDANQKAPFILALHQEHGNGAELLPLLQMDAEKKHWIVACPDASNADTWDSSDHGFQTDLRLLKRTFKKIQSRYTLDSKKCYLLGDQMGGYFLLCLLAKDPVFLKEFSGLIVINTEAQGALENKLWPTYTRPVEQHATPVLYLQTRDHANALYSRARWTRDWLKDKGFSVHYVEESSFGGGFPSHLNQKIFEWCEHEKSSGDEIQGNSNPAPVPLSNEFTILFFKKTATESKSGDSDLVSISAGQHSTVGEKQTQYYAPGRKGSFSYSIDFKPKKDFNEVKQSVRLKTVYRNVRVELKTFDAAKRITFTQSIAFFGLDGQAIDKQKYGRKNHGVVAEESSFQIDYLNTLQGGQAANVVFDVPKDRDQTFVSVTIYKDTRPVAFAMLPDSADPAEFPDLSGISVPRKKIEVHK